METTNTTGWWSCLSCDVDAELPESSLAGYEVPCPDCTEPMVLWREVATNIITALSAA
jgi:hypothetical protein